MDELQSDLERSIELLEIHGPLTLVGHSFGAAIASTYAENHPDQIENLILINPSITYRVPFYMQLPLYIPNVVFDFILNLLNKIRLEYAAPSYVLKNLYFHALSNWQADDVLPKIKQPTLVLAPEHDPIFSNEDMFAVHEEISGSEFLKIPTNAHMSMTNQPTFVNAAIAAFLGLSICPPEDEEMGKALQKASEIIQK